MPGKIIQCLKKTKTENPLILIDEVSQGKKICQKFDKYNFYFNFFFFKSMKVQNKL